MAPRADEQRRPRTPSRSSSEIASQGAPPTGPAQESPTPDALVVPRWITTKPARGAEEHGLGPDPHPVRPPARRVEPLLGPVADDPLRVRDRTAPGAGAPVRTSREPARRRRSSPRVAPPAAFAADASPVGGGLADHDSAGARIAERHVGISASALRARLEAEPWLRQASSFANSGIAEAAVSEALRAHGSRIAAWCSSRRRADLALTHELDLPAGILVARGDARPRPAATVRLIVRPDATRDAGCRLLAAHPVPPGGPAAAAAGLAAVLAACLHQDADPAGLRRSIADQRARIGPRATACAAADLEALLLRRRSDADLEQALDDLGAELRHPDRPVRDWLSDLGALLTSLPIASRGSSGMQLRWSR